MAAQIAIPCTLMRGGTSKGTFFVESDLPADTATRDRVLLAVMGSPDPRQIDGVGGAEPLTSKVAIVSRSRRPGVDVDYLFAQVLVDKPRVDVSPNCGNMLAGVAPFAIERGLVSPADPVTRVAIYMVNTGNLAIASVQTPAGQVRYDGEAAIAGVPGTAAPIDIEFRDTEGSVCGALMPTGRTRDLVESIDVSCVDNGMPVVVLPARAFGKSGYESPAELDADAHFKARLERVRIAAGALMGLGDVTERVVPKMTLIAAPRAGGHVCTRTFIPHRCHAAIGVLGAVSVATACALPGSVAEGIATLPEGSPWVLSVEHPSGEFTVRLEIEQRAAAAKQVFTVRRSAILRTARALMRGEVLVPRSVWAGR